jgi:DNA repair exonuclease SbcCD ATPase subunit
MVFGWGKKKEQKEHIDPQKQTITLSEIESILLEQKKTKLKLALQKTTPLFAQIQDELKSIEKIISQLESDDLKVDDIDKTLQVLVVRGKSEVIEVVSKESQKTLPKVSSYDDVIHASEISAHVLKKIGDVLGKNSRVIHVFAKKYAQDLKSHLGVITNYQSEISKQISEISSFDSATSTIKEMAEKIIRLNNEIGEKSRHIDKLKEFKNECVLTIDSTEQNLDSMRSSPQHAKFLEYQQQICQVSEQYTKLNKEIDDEFSKISRPLGKYVYVTSLEKPLKAILEKLTVNSSELVSLENKASIITILESCMKGIVSGAVSVKESDKSVSQITHIISLLDDFIARKDNIRLQLEGLQDKLKIFDPKQLDELEKQIERAKLDKDDTESKISNLEAEIDHDNAQRQKLIEDLHDLLQRITGTKYMIQI